MYTVWLSVVNSELQPRRKLASWMVETSTFKQMTSIDLTVIFLISKVR